jgi:hypothetical protein
LIVADTSGLLAFFNASDRHHASAVSAVESESEPLVVSPYVVAELDYLVARRVGVGAELGVLQQLAGGGFALATFDEGDLAAAAAVIDRYRDQDIGVTDASLVVLADRHRTRTLLTLDHRHFDVVRPLAGGRFRLVP